MFLVLMSGGLFAFNARERLSIVGDVGRGGSERTVDGVMCFVGDE